MKARFPFLAVVMVVTGWSNSQELPAKKVPQFSLHTLETAPVGFPDDYGFWSSAQCNQDGTVYWRAAKIGDFESDPVWKISPKWDRYTELSLPKDLLEEEFLLQSFTVTPDGPFYGVAYNRLNGQMLLLRFDSRGRVSSRTTLEVAERMIPQFVAVFPRGETLVYGQPYEEASQVCRKLSPDEVRESLNAAGKEVQHRLAIYAPDGRLLAPIKLPKTTESDHKKRETAAIASRWAVAMGEDGNAYLLQSTQILVVSARGEVVRTIPLSDIPSGFVPTNIQASHGILSIEFTKGKINALVEGVRFRTIEAATGTVQAEYVPESDLGRASQLCFTANEGYTFYMVKDKKSYFVRAWTE